MFYPIFFRRRTIILKNWNGELYPQLPASDALALIFSGAVTTWDDPAIVASAQGASTARGGGCNPEYSYGCVMASFVTRAGNLCANHSPIFTSTIFTVRSNEFWQQNERSIFAQKVVPRVFGLSIIKTIA